MGAGATSSPLECKNPRDGRADVLVVLFDISKSTDSKELRRQYGDDFDQWVTSSFADKEGALYGDGADVAVGAIDQASGTDFHPSQCDVPPKGSDDNPLLYDLKVRRYGEQIQAAAHRIVDGPREAKGTAILDALKGASNLAQGWSSAEHKYLVIFSDMVEESQRLKMTDKALQPKQVAAFVKQERRAGNLPKLDGFEVYVAGAGSSTTSSGSVLKRDAIRRFWTSYLHAAGATLAPQNYNGRLLRFP